MDDFILWALLLRGSKGENAASAERDVCKLKQRIHELERAQQETSQWQEQGPSEEPDEPSGAAITEEEFLEATRQYEKTVDDFYLNGSLRIYRFKIGDNVWRIDIEHGIIAYVSKNGRSA